MRSDPRDEPDRPLPRVHCVRPLEAGATLRFDHQRNERWAPEIVASTPLGRWGDAGAVAGAAVHLASDPARFVTGTTLFVDGGWSAQ